MKRCRILLGCLFASCWLLPGGAGGQVITEFNISGGPEFITAGPDGNLWFTEYSSNRIGRITPLGVVTEFSIGISDGARPLNITAGPDGNLWFTEYLGGRIGRITPLGVITEFSDGISPSPLINGITAGPDGNLWFTEQLWHRIGRITPLGVVTEFSDGISPGAYPYGITAGPDGNLWFAEAQDRIGRITPLGVVTEFTAGITPNAAPVFITTGPDGNLWFTEYNGNQIGRITPLGVVTEFPARGSPAGITAGPDGNLWFTEFNAGRIGRITTGPAKAADFYTLTPCRLADTRGASGPYGGPSLVAGADRTFVFAGQCGIPSNATAVVLNVVAISPTSGPGFLTLYPGETTRPPTSTINYNAGRIRANNAIIPLGALMDITVYCLQNSGTTDMVIDVNGYFQ